VAHIGQVCGQADIRQVGVNSSKVGVTSGPLKRAVALSHSKDSSFISNGNGLNGLFSKKIVYLNILHDVIEKFREGFTLTVCTIVGRGE
tara:strand:- start:48 stop:314 length:267 start_codon:yes stop_codon:yes gene_type:complete